LSRGLRRGVYGVAALLAVQLALGGWVSTNYAVLACSDFPTCQGAWWPTMDFAHGFTLLRPLGIGHDGEPIPFPALTAIHVTHRMGALVVLASRLIATRGHAERRFAQGLLAIAAWQLASGLGNVMLGWPLAAAVAHTGGAAALVTLLTVLLARAHEARRPQAYRASAASTASPA